jgi:hypothetical protein
MCQKTLTRRPAAQLREATYEFVRGMERVWGVSFPEGRNQGLAFMAHCWEDLRVLPKPLALHLASELGGLACHAALRAMGFRALRCQVSARAPAPARTPACRCACC